MTPSFPFPPFPSSPSLPLPSPSLPSSLLHPKASPAEETWSHPSPWDCGGSPAAGRYLKHQTSCGIHRNLTPLQSGAEEPWGEGQPGEWGGRRGGGVGGGGGTLFVDARCSGRCQKGCTIQWPATPSLTNTSSLRSLTEQWLHSSAHSKIPPSHYWR